jgi:hypothetical protein
MKEKEEEERQAILKKKKEEENALLDDEPEQQKPYDPYEKKEDPKRFDIIEKFDYIETKFKNSPGEHLVEYDEKDISLYEVFANYGTTARPKKNPKHDPPQPPPKEKKKPPTPPPKEEPKEGEEGEGEGQEVPPVVEEEEEEEVWIPPVDKVVYYDFKAHNG